MEPNRRRSVKLLSAVIVASTVVVGGALAVAINQERTGTSLGSIDMTSKQMTQGGTVTESAVKTTLDPTTIETTKVTPTLKADRPRGF